MDIDMKLNNGKWFSLNEEQVDTIKKLADEYPYTIELISGIYMEQKFSEEKTRDILSKRLIYGENLGSVT